MNKVVQGTLDMIFTHGSDRHRAQTSNPLRIFVHILGGDFSQRTNSPVISTRPGRINAILHGNKWHDTTKALHKEVNVSNHQTYRWVQSNIERVISEHPRLYHPKKPKNPQNIKAELKNSDRNWLTSNVSWCLSHVFPFPSYCTENFLQLVLKWRELWMPQHIRYIL